MTPKKHFVCPDCGPHVRVDEDHCCSMCGVDCEVKECRCENREVYCWLIERGQAVHQSPTIWFKGEQDQLERRSYEEDWTEDATKATRYWTKKDAEWVARRLFGETATVTEHGFVK